MDHSMSSLLSNNVRLKNPGDGHAVVHNPAYSSTRRAGEIHGLLPGAFTVRRLTPTCLQLPFTSCCGAIVPKLIRFAAARGPDFPPPESSAG
jgi:hypothetical protein